MTFVYSYSKSISKVFKTFLMEILILIVLLNTYRGFFEYSPVEINPTNKHSFDVENPYMNYINLANSCTCSTKFNLNS